MLQHLDPVPFTIDNDTHFGLSETQGLLSCNSDALVIEYRIADTISGLLKSASKRITVPFAEIQSLTYQKKMLGFSNRITLRTRSQHIIESLPEARMGTVTMAIRRGDREAAEGFCLAVQQAAVQERGRRIQQDVERLDHGTAGDLG